MGNIILKGFLHKITKGTGQDALSAGLICTSWEEGGCFTLYAQILRNGGGEGDRHQAEGTPREVREDVRGDEGTDGFEGKARAATPGG